MTSTSSAPNMVPAIASTALPSTPASEWAEGMNDILGSHVTRTPVTTPGPAVPGGFPAHLEPDPQPALSTEKDPVNGQGQGQAQDGSLLESAQAYLPTLATAKAYLPQGVAAYLPSPEPLTSEASLPPLPPSSSTLAASSVSASASASSASTLPTTIDSHAVAAPTTSSDSPYFPRTAPRASPDRGATDDSVALSTMAHTGHSYSSTSPFASLSASTTSPSVSATPASGNANAASPALVQSPPVLSPRGSTDLALAAQHQDPHPHPQSSQSSPPPSFSLSSSSLTQERDAAVHAQAQSNENVHAVPTSSLVGAHSHPHAVPNVAELISTPPGSLPSLDSGYAASTESESVATPSSLANLYAGMAEPETPVATPVVPAGAQQPVYGVPGQGLREGGVQARVGLAGAGMNPSPSLHPVNAAHSPAPVDATAPAPVPAPAPALETQSSSVDGDDEGDGNASGDTLDNEGDVDGVDGADADAVEGSEGKDVDTEKKGKKEGKKPKLMQRLKEKMHVGGGSA
ncbi:hypothetical protein DFH06DRAFT_1252837 [Mycena polygramma]|nr:hypothetical protein DFH06DRAFT_1252837 [Mycena polygramma]